MSKSLTLNNSGRRNKRRDLLKLMAAGAGSQILPARAGEAPKAPLVTVKIGYFSTIAHVAPVFIGKALGYYEAEGINLEPVEFGTANLAIPALVTGDLQAVIGLSVGAAVYNALIAEPGSMRLTAACITAHPEDILGTFVGKGLYDKGIKSPADLKGKTIYMPARGGVPEYSLAMALQKHGLSIKDVKILNLPGYPEIYQGLQAKTVEFGVLGEPYASEAKDKGIAMPIAPYGPYIAGVQLTYMAVGKKLLNEQRDVSVRLMRAYLKSIRYYEQARTKGPNRKDAIRFMQAGLKGATPQAIDSSIWYYLQPDGKVDVPSLDAQAKYFSEQGFIKTLLPVDRVVDTSILTAASK